MDKFRAFTMKFCPRLFLMLIASLCCFPIQAQTSHDLPNIVKNNEGKYSLMVDGKPFLVLGAQLWNSSSWPEITNQFWVQAKTLGCNTIEAPVYWQNIEPEPGKFNFTELDHLILSARQQELKLILLWFGSYKNGRSQYAPPWVLENTESYPRMLNASGEEIYVLSAVSENNLEADKKAFVALMKHIKSIDSNHHTVIMMQVENEPGSMWTDRDYSPAANTLFEASLPEKFASKMNFEQKNWTEAFGIDAPEAFNAYHIANYINEIAAAGRQIYNLPMYTNVWIRENGFQRPGEYPSGGPTSNMIEVWKAAAPQIDLLALDIYHSNVNVFNKLCDIYARQDNPLFIPEMGNGDHFARFQFYAIGNYNALGVAPYGIDPFHLDPRDERDSDSLDQKFEGIAKNYHLLSQAILPITQLQATDRLHAAGEEQGVTEYLMRLENYDLLLRYGFPTYKDPNRQTGRVLVGQLGEDEFLLIGFDTKFTFRSSFGSGYHDAEYVLVEQGHYESEQWVRERIWNGDALYHSTLPAEGAILKIKLRRVKSHNPGSEKANFDKDNQ